MPAPSPHLEADRLEQLAEGTLPSGEAAEARSHIDACGRCLAEFESYRGLFAMLGDLPRFAPSPAFADAVMARVRVAPAESAVFAWLRRFIPKRRRGWVLLGTLIAAPIAPLIALAAWLLFHPLVSPTTLGQWGLLRAQALFEMSTSWIAENVLGAYLPALLEMLYTEVQAIPSSTVTALLALLAIAIPLSVWGLVRLTRTPVGSVTYAN